MIRAIDALPRLARPAGNVPLLRGRAPRRRHAPDPRGGVRAAQGGVVQRVENAGLDQPRRDRHDDLHRTREAVSAATRIGEEPRLGRRARPLSQAHGRAARPRRRMGERRIVAKDRQPNPRRGARRRGDPGHLGRRPGAPHGGDLVLRGIARAARAAGTRCTPRRGWRECVCNHPRGQQGPRSARPFTPRRSMKRSGAAGHRPCSAVARGWAWHGWWDISAWRSCGRGIAAAGTRRGRGTTR